MKKLICLFFGHIPIKGLFETPEIISNRGCKRCGSALFAYGLHWKGIRSAPMPGVTKKEWDMYCDKKEESLRKQFSQ
jgi:hypothetical protein